MRFAFYILLAGTTFCYAQQGAIQGRVLARNTGEALAGVNVLVQGTTRGTVTNADGNFTLTALQPGTYGVTFSLVGYQREVRTGLEVVAGGTLTINVEMTQSPILGEGIVVTASKRAQSLQDAPVSVSTMDAASIARRNVITLDDALRYVPGVNLTQDQVNVRGSSGYSRGAGSRVLLLVDGIPFTTGDTGEINFEVIPMGEVERIEVVKGAASALYGSSALGGVINIITKRIPEMAETHVRSYGGFYNGPSFAQWDWHGGTRFLDGESFSHSQRIGNLGLLLYGSRAANDGYKQNDFRRRYNGYLKLSADLAPDDAFVSTFNIMHQRRGSFLYWRDIDHALVPPDVEQGNFVESNRFFWSGQYTHTASSSLLTVARAMWFHNRFDDAIDTATHTSRSDVLRGELQATWYAGPSHIITFGAEGNTDHVNANLFGTRSGFGAAFYAQDEIEIVGDFKATIGARFDFEDLDSLPSVSQFNPKIGLVYTPVVGTTLRSSFGAGFRAPSVAEAFVTTNLSGFPIIPNPNLKPEQSYTFEIGASQVVGNTAMFDVAWFASHFDDLIESGFTPQLQGQFNNVTKARIEGIELSTRVGLLDNSLLFGVGYTYVRPKDLTTGDILKYRPRNLLYAQATAHAGMFDAGVEFRYISRVERIDEEFVTLGVVIDGDRRVPTYVTDIRIGADLEGIGIPLTVRLNIDNLFQYNYVELIGNIAPPRSYVLTLETQL